MRRIRRIGIVFGLAVGVVSISTLGVRVLPASYHLEQRPGTTEQHILTVINDTASPEELSLYVGDWQRFEDGEHDWGLKVNSARWVFPRTLAAGEEVDILYSIRLPASREVAVAGTFEVRAPQLSGDIDGSDVVGPDSIGGVPASSTSDAIRIVRTIESVDVQGLAVVRLSIRCATDLEGLVITERTTQRVEFASVDDAGARFDTVNRSNAEWLSLSHERAVLQPDESRDITLTIAMPENASGMYWAAVFVQSQPQAAEDGGTRVISIYRTAIKIYTTAMGSAVLAGRVVDVQVGEMSPLVVYALFENTGNTELTVTGEMQIIDRTGAVVRLVPVDAFKVLPGARRIVTIEEASGNGDGLAADIYQAVVSFDYGGDSSVVGVRGFRVR